MCCRTRGNYARNSRIPRLRRLRTCRRSRRTSFPRTLCMPPSRRRAGSFGTTSTRSGCRRWRSCRWSCSSRSYVVALSLTGRVTLARATRPTRKPDRHVGSRVVSAPRTHGTVMARVAGASAEDGRRLAWRRGGCDDGARPVRRAAGAWPGVSLARALRVFAGAPRRHVGVAAAD